MAPLQQVARPGPPPAAAAIARVFGQFLAGPVPIAVWAAERLHDPRAAEDHDRRADVVLLEVQLRLEQFQFQPCRPHLRPHQEIDVLVGHAIAGRLREFSTGWRRGRRAWQGKSLHKGRNKIELRISSDVVDFEDKLEVGNDLANSRLKLMGVDDVPQSRRPVTLPIVGNGEKIVILGETSLVPTQWLGRASSSSAASARPSSKAVSTSMPRLRSPLVTAPRT